MDKLDLHNVCGGAAKQLFERAVDDRTYLLNIASRITGETVVQSEDNGAAQKVAVRQGPALKEQVDVRPVVLLAPFRTFSEVTQVVSPFLFRVKQSGNEIPTMTLFEADGGAWQVDAIRNIAYFLTDAVSKLDGDAAKVPVIS